VDKLKDVPRIINMVGELFGFYGQKNPEFGVLSQVILTEIELLDQNCLRMRRIKQKTNRRRRRLVTPVVGIPVNYDTAEMCSHLNTFEFRDLFLMKYAIIMTIGDLILSTNIAYIDEFKNLVPYSRLNRLSTISMLTHTYDGTSYGLSKTYEEIKPSDSGVLDLRQCLL